MANKLLPAIAVLLVLAAALAPASGARRLPSVAEVISDAADDVAPLIHMLRPRLASGAAHHRLGLGKAAQVPCDSWRFAVETNSARDWRTIPAECVDYVGNYMMGGHYRNDSRAVIDEAVAYAEGLQLAGDGKEVWVFDVDETTISNLPYYAKHGFGAEPYNGASFGEYAKEASAPALPETKRLYDRLLELGIKPVILTGRREDKREATATNLERAGYTGYLELIVKPQDARVRSLDFKAGERKKLEDKGYVIVGNIGDQWTDILGAPEGKRTFKLPDPMYYVG